MPFRSSRTGGDRRRTPPSPEWSAVPVGRSRELDGLVRRLTSPSSAGVLLVAESGLGRSCLARAVAARLSESGHPVEQVRVLRGGDPSPLPELDPSTVVVVDDAHLLSDAAAATIHDLSMSGSCRLLLTMPVDAVPAEPVAALLKDGDFERLELDALGRDACDELVVQLVGGPVDALTAQRLWALTRGRPRTVVELVGGLVADGLLVPDEAGAATWPPPGRLPRSLLAGLEAVLGDLTPAEQEALDLVACAPPGGPGPLTAAGVRAEALETLERRGLLRVVPSKRRLVVEVADSLLQAAVRQRLGRLRRRRLAARLAEATDRRRRWGDLATWARLVLDGAGTLDPDQAEKASRQALHVGDVSLAERLARYAFDAGGGAAAAESLARALSLQDRVAEAKAVLSGVDRGAGHGPPPPVRAADLRWSLDDVGTATLIAESVHFEGPPNDRTASTVALGLFALSGCRYSEALALADDVVSVTHRTGTLFWVASALRIAALTSLGRAEEAATTAREAIAELGADPAAATPVPPAFRHVILGSAARALLTWGDLDAVEDLAGRCRAWADQDPRRLLAAATWSGFLGETALRRGRVSTAVHLLEQAAGMYQGETRGLLGRLGELQALRTLASAYLQAGRSDDARRIYLTLSEKDLTTFRIIDLGAGELEGLVVAATSSTAAGVERLLARAEEVRALGAWGPYVELLHDVVRIGGADRLPAGALDDVEVEGGLPRARADAVRAALAKDGPGFDDAARRFEACGAQLFAAEAAAHAARTYELEGDLRSARRAAASAQACLARCEDPRTPPLDLLAEPATLTPRQRDVARLAARGLTSRQIADELSLSVRTVDNCLGQVYRRWGITSRSELVVVLGPR